jgi:hypothetical protein
LPRISGRCGMASPVLAIPATSPRRQAE